MPAVSAGSPAAKLPTSAPVLELNSDTVGATPGPVPATIICPLFLNTSARSRLTPPRVCASPAKKLASTLFCLTSRTSTRGPPVLPAPTITWS